MASLYKLAGDCLQLKNEFDELIESGDAEPTEAVIALMEAVEADIIANKEDREKKYDSYAYLIRMFKGDYKIAHEEAERLINRAAMFKTTYERLQNRLMAVMELLQERKVKTPTNTISICGNGGVQSVTCQVRPETLPKEFQKVIIEPNNEALRKALVSGQTVPGCQLVPRGSHLRLS